MTSIEVDGAARRGRAQTAARSSTASRSRPRRARSSGSSASRARGRRPLPWRCSATRGRERGSSRGSVRVADVPILDLAPEALREARGQARRLRAAGSVGRAQPGAADRPPARRAARRARSRRGSGRIAESLAEVALPSDPGFLRRYPHQLSGGQQQRVCLAMAFLLRPAAIVLDEPTTGLDVTTQAHVLETVRDLCRSHGTAAVYVSHDLAAVAAIAARVRRALRGPGRRGRACGAALRPAAATRTRASSRPRSRTSPSAAASRRSPASSRRRARAAPAACSRPRCEYAVERLLGGAAAARSRSGRGTGCAACGSPSSSRRRLRRSCRRGARPRSPRPCSRCATVERFPRRRSRCCTTSRSRSAAPSALRSWASRAPARRRSPG